ncbi:methylated-DNA--[protein]-cysteine S-methyltransferase [Chitinophaga alhagiae]|uniref:methylated-DNA--[protein]-cysteine S-methyltransferase n=1 Tax=Chitinophaga alhagiae TaxID=2203219 RepID=UPI0013006172|nr:methylated-DNA--[protein]-cysteine S-methyltransferase [Chitinophaga alhagiae]
MQTITQDLHPAAIRARMTNLPQDARRQHQPAVTIRELKKEELPGLPIHYGVYNTAIGEILLAATPQGICYAGFTNGYRELALTDLGRRLTGAAFSKQEDVFHQQALQWLNHPGRTRQPLRLHLKGTPFQLSIWQKLLAIPSGAVTTYAQLAGSSQMARAAGTAVGDNPVCFLVPCHRVVRSNGKFDGYFWGTERKKQLLAMEAQRR